MIVDPGFSHVPHIPPLVFEIDPHLQIPPRFWGDGGPIGPDPFVIDPSPIGRFVSEDAYIRQGINMNGGVRFGDNNIGPAGAIAKDRARF